MGDENKKNVLPVAGGDDSLNADATATNSATNTDTQPPITSTAAAVEPTNTDTEPPTTSTSGAVDPNRKMSKQTYLPPEFISDASEYPEYRRRLQRWSRITKVDKSQQAEVVVYYLEGHPSGIQDKIDSNLGNQIIEKEDGLDKLIAYLDTIYGVDDMMDAWRKYKEFVQLKKMRDQPINEFIAVFNAKYMKAKESGCEFSDTVLAFNLLESCKLSETDEKFVLTRIDFKKGKEEKNLLNQVKESLRVFNSRESRHQERKVEFDETLVTNIKETLMSKGWTPPTPTSKPNNVPLNSPHYKGKKNPLGNDGKPIKCHFCDSEYHFLDKCPDREKQNQRKKATAFAKKKTAESNDSSALLALLKSHASFSRKGEDEEEEEVMVTFQESELCLLIKEAGKRGVIDTACSKTVAGVAWVTEYTDELPQDLSELKCKESKKIYQFGGGEKRPSLGCIRLPVLIGEKKIQVEVEVVEANIPLLVGSNSLKAAKAKLNYENYCATFFDQEVKMHEIGSGHVCINLFTENICTFVSNIEERERYTEIVLAVTNELNEKNIKKLHHMFGHVPADRLKKFISKTGKLSKDIEQVIENISNTCDACLKTQRRVPRPKAAIPRADAPNEIVTVDLKEYDSHSTKRKYICYVIDLHSRMTVADFIHEKKPEEIVKILLRLWIPQYGLMKCLHSDIGGENSNDLIEDVASNLGVKLTTTSAYSPHQNGVNERNHAIVDLMMTRMIESDSELSPELALCWALQAKNSLENVYGFSPYQLHIGYNPILPSATRDGPPALESVTKSKALSRHLNAMHAAREAFVEMESSAVLKRALKSKVFPRGDELQEGDWIYHIKNAGRSGRVWRGPSRCVATNGKKLFIDQGARLGTVNRDDAVKVGNELWRIDEEDEEQETSSQQVEKEAIKEQREGRESSDEEVEEENRGANGTEIGGDISRNQDCETNKEKEKDLNESNLNEAGGKTYTFKDIKKNDIIKYTLPDKETECARVLGRAGKSTTNTKYWWNVKDMKTGEEKSLNTEKCVNLEKSTTDEETEDALLVMIPRHQHAQKDCVEAKQKELDNWDNFQAYEEVEDVGQERLSTNWILVMKEGKVKARLCVCGNQEKNKENIRTDSPTVHKTSVKLFYLLAAKNNWTIKTADVKAAFLQGAAIDRDVYVIPPKERRRPGILWKMLKSTYGFVDASRRFYLELEKALIEYGCVESKLDPAMYLYYNTSDNELGGLMLTHVDDMLHGSGGSEFEKNVMQPLRERFLFGSEEESFFKYVGLSVSKQGDSIHVSQDSYVDSLCAPDTDDFATMPGHSLVNENGQTTFRELVGKLGWLANTTRPDLCFDKLTLSTKVGKATVTDIKSAAKIIRKAKSEPSGMMFPNLGSPNEWTIQAYGDGAHKSMPDKVGSSGGQVILLVNNEKDTRCVVSWRSRKLKRVVTSSTAAEALAVNDALDEAVYVKDLLIELLGTSATNIPIELFTDSRNLYRSVMSTSLCDNPRLRSDVAKLKESLNVGEMNKLIKVDGSEMLADCLTKKGACSRNLMHILRTCQLRK